MPAHARLILSAGLLAFAACSSDDPTAPGSNNTNPVATINLSPPSYSVGVGQTVTFVALLADANGQPISGRTITWISTNTSFATVENGIVSGVKVGSSTITATIEGQTKSAPVVVNATPTVQATFSTMAPGADHTCALNLAGKAYCWGSNALSQLGAGTVAGLATVPQAVSGNLTFASIASGEYHTCALTPAGVAYCWGWNIKGQLGDSTNINRNVPTLVKTPLTFSTITTAGQPGGEHSCALTTAGAAYCWGWNIFGQLGDNSTTDRIAPVAVVGGLTFSTISSGNLHTCGLTTAMKLYCWGTSSETGEGVTTNRSVPTAIAPTLTFKSLTSTWTGSCAITTTDATYCWGANNSPSTVATPTLIPNFTFTSVVSAYEETCGLIAGGAAYCWGVNNAGQVGDGTSSNRSTPVPVTGAIAFSKLFAGDGLICGLTANNLAWCWGLGTSGQLGSGSQLSRLVPFAVRAPL